MWGNIFGNIANTAQLSTCPHCGIVMTGGGMCNTCQAQAQNQWNAANQQSHSYLNQQAMNNRLSGASSGMAGMSQWQGQNISTIPTLVLNRYTTLKDHQKGLKDFVGHVYIDDKTTHILGMLEIKGIIQFHFNNKALETIFNKYVGTGDILSAQDELIDAGFIDQARL